MENKERYSLELTDRQWGIIYNALFLEPCKLAEKDEEVGEITKTIANARQKARVRVGLENKLLMHINTEAIIHISTDNSVDLESIIKVLKAERIKTKFA